MSAFAISIIINIALTAIVALLICILVMVIKSKKQKAIAEYNRAIEERDSLLNELRTKGEKYNDKIKTTQNINDFVDLHNSILQDYGNKH